jgi:beta-1,4-mannosyltransferase
VGVLISSTSWTEDEDFELLLDALLQVETYLQQASVTQQVTLSGYSRLVVLITGKGPLRCSFEKRVQELALQGRINQCVAVRTLWLSIEDYPQLLRCADLGTYP